VRRLSTEAKKSKNRGRPTQVVNPVVCNSSEENEYQTPPPLGTLTRRRAAALNTSLSSVVSKESTAKCTTNVVKMPVKKKGGRPCKSSKVVKNLASSD
jgi:hypothetical protein